ncbi:MAG: hypothetical protein LBH22_07155, partial [Bacteroidales bacterium]|nr:hypothetical protein [Bacteroidales bacterium]
MKKILSLSAGILLVGSSIMAEGLPKKQVQTIQRTKGCALEARKNLLPNSLKVNPQMETKTDTRKENQRKPITGFKNELEKFKPGINRPALSIMNLKTVQRLDSIVDIDDPTGHEIQKALFFYNDTYGWPTVMQGIGHGYLDEEMTYEWHEEGNLKGYMKSFTHIHYGWMIATKEVYSYNADKLADTMWTYKYDWNNESWTPDDLFVFRYDGNAIEAYVWRISNGEYVHILREYATYDNLARQLTYRSYFKEFDEVWDDELGEWVASWGTRWIGQGREDKEYWPGSTTTDFLTFLQGWLWSETKEDWEPFRRSFHEFNVRGQFTEQRIENWNKENQNWNGGVIHWGMPDYNGKTTQTFDTEFKQTSETVYRFKDGVWELRAEVDFTWEKIDEEWNLHREAFS